MSTVVRYEGTVYRPPSESGSLIIQATIGCPHNHCAFCGMYTSKRFLVRPTEDIIDDLDGALATCGPSLRTLFLADGNCAALPSGSLIEIARAAHARFPNLERITTYGSAKYLVKKSLAEWQDIAAAGITRIHSGLESGDDETLAAIRKGVTPAQAIEAFNHVVDAGLDLSVYVMVGVAGRERSREHAEGSAAVLNQTRPHFVRLRTFVPIVGTPWYDRWKDGKLTLLTAHEAVDETLGLVERMTGPTRLLSDHMSNFVNVFGDLPEEKEQMLAGLREALHWPIANFRPPTEELVGVML